jgi:7-cyano-7-deazaguanine synthase in queuosine biosynthesis
MKIVILYSSGLDSRIMLHYAQQKYPDADIKCIYYQHGAESEQHELSLLPDFVEVRKIDWLGEKIKPVAKKEDPFAGAIYIPGRNLVFSVLAASQELADEIWMGTLYDEVNPKGTDKNDTFRNLTSGVLSYVLSPFIDNVTIRFPFAEEKWTKVDAVSWALDNGLSKEEIVDTTSCWHRVKGERPCGRCKQCFKRQLVLMLNDIEEDCKFNPLDEKWGLHLAQSYIDVVLKGSTNLDENNVYNMLCNLKTKNKLPNSLYGLKFNG